MKKIFFALGGNDAEMESIKTLLNMAGVEWIQPKKEWGNHSYGLEDLSLSVEKREQMVSMGGGGGLHKWEVLVRGEEELEEVVFVECTPSSMEGFLNKTMVIDHHGEKAGLPASVLQTLSLLEGTVKGFRVSEGTRRWVELVGANDSSYIPGMRSLGATGEEVERIRLLDRSAQGITPNQEKEAERAISQAKEDGWLTVIRMDHSKTATVTDRLFSRYDQLLILSRDGEANFFGDGALCFDLKVKFEGWNGGSGLGKKGETAFWGGYPNLLEVEAFIRGYLELPSA